MNFRAEGSRRREATLEMTPLIDVVFLLLVFFLLTTTFARPTPTESRTEDTEAVIDVDLPTAGSGVASSPSERVRVTLDDQGMIYIDDEQAPIAPNELKRRLMELKEGGAEPVVDLRADAKATHGATIELLDIVKETGITSVNFVIQRRE